MSAPDPAALAVLIARLTGVAEEMGAATSVLTGGDVARALADEARRLNCATLVIGRAEPATGWRRLWPAEPLRRALARRAPALDIVEAGDLEGQCAHSQHDGVDSECFPLADLLAHLLRRADEPSRAELVEIGECLDARR